MKMTKRLTTTILSGTCILGTALFLAGNVSAKGPIPITSYDADGNGTITEQEFNNARAKQQEAMKASGRLGKGMASSPSFADADSDKDGLLSVEEIKAMQAQQQANRGKGKGQGTGKGFGKANQN